MTSKVLFIDRDGTLIEEPHDNQVDALDKIRLVRGVIPALLELADNGYRFVMVSNQDGLGTESFPLEHFEACHQHVIALFESQGITFDETFICPHFEGDGCDCRKPRTGLLTRFLARNHLDPANSAVIGDRGTDLELAEKLGLRGFLVDPEASYETSWPGIVAALCGGDRIADVERNTRETSIRASVNLDSEGRIDVGTGIGFFDHMLEQIAKHYPGDEVSLKVDRNGKQSEYLVTLRNQNGEEKIVKREAAGILDLLGVELEEIDAETAAKIEAKSGLRITKIKSGTLKRSTDAKVGFIITKVDGKEIRMVDDFTSYLEKKEGGVLLEGVYEDLPGKYYYAFGL